MALDEDSLRRQMVEEQIVRRGINDPSLLFSLLEVPRHRFVPPQWQPYAYADSPLPLTLGQTISQPYIVAIMIQAAQLNPSSRVLEIGTGSGYSAAILSRMAAEVYTMERLPTLAEAAKTLFQELNYTNIFVSVGDGSLGWPEKAPFDAIVVTAGAPTAPQALIDQLSENGRLIIPIGDNFMQQLCCYYKRPDRTIRQDILDWVRFVPLIGEQGWKLLEE